MTLGSSGPEAANEGRGRDTWGKPSWCMQLTHSAARNFIGVARTSSSLQAACQAEHTLQGGHREGTGRVRVGFGVRVGAQDKDHS